MVEPPPLKIVVEFAILFVFLPFLVGQWFFAPALKFAFTAGPFMMSIALAVFTALSDDVDEKDRQEVLRILHLQDLLEFARISQRWKEFKREEEPQAAVPAGPAPPLPPRKHAPAASSAPASAAAAASPLSLDTSQLDEKAIVASLQGAKVRATMSGLSCPSGSQSVW